MSADMARTRAWEDVIEAITTAIDTDELPARDRGRLAEIHSKALQLSTIHFDEHHVDVPDTFPGDWIDVSSSRGGGPGGFPGEIDPDGRYVDARSEGGLLELHDYIDSAAREILYKLIDRCDVRTVSQLEAIPERDLLAVNGLGPSRLRALRDAIGAWRAAGCRPKPRDFVPLAQRRALAEEAWQRSTVPGGLRELHLSQTIITRLTYAGIGTVAELAKMSDDEILRVNGLGPTSLANIRAALAETREIRR